MDSSMHNNLTDEAIESQRHSDTSSQSFSHPYGKSPLHSITTQDESTSSHGFADSTSHLLSRSWISRNADSAIVGPRRANYVRTLLILAIIAFLAAIAMLGLDKITKDWKAPIDSIRLLSPWPTDFSQAIEPKRCHSHNDYWRQVPLYDALASGCIGVEADIWLPENNRSTELRVSHSYGSLTGDRTLSSLYIEPLAEILQHRNSSGIFDVDANQTVVLLLDFKSNGADLWPLVQQSLDPLRHSGWLRHWNSKLNQTVPGPLTIVASGNAPFDLITSNTIYRDIFLDAPLDKITSGLYNNTNSYYASVSMIKTLGISWFGHFSKSQTQTLTTQVEEAAKKGLLSRYWGTQSWPVSVRDRV